MFKNKPSQHIQFYLLTVSVIIAVFSSCGVVPKNYPVAKPFVYKTNIDIEGNLAKEEKNILKERLQNQLHDSIQVKTIGQLFREVLKNPPVYDSANADRSLLFMRTLLHSEGYFSNSISYSDTIKLVKKNKKGNQYRSYINFTVIPGKQYKLDSVSYNIKKPGLQLLAKAYQENAIIKKGTAFSQQKIAGELDRLVDIYRNNGYLHISREELSGLWDTLDVSLLKPAFSLEEQILQLQKLQERRENPVANLEIKLRTGYDSSKIKKFYVGNTVIYPEYTGEEYMAANPIVFDSNYAIVSDKHLFKQKFLIKNIFFKRGDVYNQNQYIKTINRFNNLGAWKLVNIEQIERPGSDTVDFNIRLTPANKYSFNANLETSLNNNLLFQGNLLGLGGNIKLLNRNFARSASQANTTVNYNVELSTKGNFIASQLASVGHTILFPRPIPNMKFLPEKFRENFRTRFAFNVSNSERINFFNITSVNLSWGYSTSWRNKSLRILFPNVEYTFLRKRDSLISLIKKNPSLENIFNQGFVFSTQVSYEVRGGKGKAANIFRANFEESGNITQLIRIKAFDSLYRFVKFDAEFIRSISFGKKQLVSRTFAGMGIAMKTSTRKDNVNLPFFRQYYAGGPASMRAWGARTLGPGTTQRDRSETPLRFGDIQFETNLELRFPLFRIAGYSVNSALFTDVGNVWFRKANPDFPGGQLTDFNKFFNDLAVGVGTGIRVDFEFFLLRLDYSVKAKNPSPVVYSPGATKWFYGWKPLSVPGVLQLDLSYPFTR